MFHQAMSERKCSCHTGGLTPLNSGVHKLLRLPSTSYSAGKKRDEVLQMTLLQPRLAILDETDSGLDIDALRIVAHGIEKLRNPERSMLIITHYPRLLEYVKPDRVHVLRAGRIVREGGPELAYELEEMGYGPGEATAEPADATPTDTADPSGSHAEPDDGPQAPQARSLL